MAHSYATLQMVVALKRLTSLRMMCHKEDIGREPINWASVETFLTNQVEALTKPMFAEKDKKIAYLEMKVATHEAGLTTDDE